jgi:cysteine desulfurase
VRPIYLDYHATTPVDPAVVTAMLPFFTEHYGNPSSRAHAFGQEAHRAVEEARAEVAALIGASPEEIVFTSGATEADNLALKGPTLAHPGGHILTTVIEHAAVLEPCRSLEREGFAVTRLAVGEAGVVEAGDLAAALRPDTVLVSMMAANNEIGTLQPVAEAGALCRERGILFHSDAVQALGHIPVNVAAWNVDLMSLSAHKMCGPKGVGALYVRKGRRRLKAQVEGGGQERGLRAGTLNVPGIVGFGAAARLAASALASGEAERISAQRDRLFALLRAGIDGVELNGAAQPRLPGNLNLSISRAEAETLVLSLQGRLAISSGAACSEAGGKGSHVLRALGLPDERVYTALRFGLGRGTTDSEVDSAAKAVQEAVLAARARTAPVLL